jgi:hypothetical protein
MQNSPRSKDLYLIGAGSLGILIDHTLTVIMMFVFMLVLNLMRHIGSTSTTQIMSRLCRNGEAGGGGFEFMTLLVTHRVSGLKEVL